MLSARPFALLALRALHGAVDYGEDLRPARAEGIHRAGFDQALDHAPVEQPRVHVIAKLVQRREAAKLAARLENSLHRVLTHVLDRLQAEPYRFADRSEMERARIDIRREHCDPHPARLVDVFHDFLGVAGF